PGNEIIIEQVRLIGIASGLPPATAEQNAGQQRAILDMVKQERDLPTLERELHDKLASLGMPSAQIDGQVKGLTSPWYRFFIAYEPAPVLAKVTGPVLAISGEKDLQVPPAQNLPALRRALASNPAAQIDEIPGVNHLFQTASTGSPMEYATIEETIAP